MTEILMFVVWAATVFIAYRHGREDEHLAQLEREIKRSADAPAELDTAPRPVR